MKHFSAYPRKKNEHFLFHFSPFVSGNMEGFYLDRKWLLYILGLTVISVSAGIVYGWPILRRQLLDEGGGLSEAQLGLIYTAGAVSSNAGRFFTGMIRDAMGTRFACVGCLLSVMLGTIIIALAEPDDETSLTAGIFLLGIGSGVLLCMQPVTQLFPANSSAMMAAMAGAFQISGLIFLLLSVVADRLEAYLGFAAFLLIMVALCVWFLPPTAKFISTASDTANVSSNPIDTNVTGADTTTIVAEGVLKWREEGLENGQSRWEQMRSTEYWLLVLWLVIVITPTQFYILSLGYQMEQKGDATGAYNNIFVFIYAGMALFAPISGAVADSMGLGVAQALATGLVAISFAFLAAPASTPLWVQGLGFCFYGLGRLLIFGMYCSNVGRRFGFENYGILVGFGLLCSAISSLLQYSLLEWGLQDGMWEVNITCLAVLVCTMPYMVWLGLREREEWGRIGAHTPKDTGNDNSYSEVGEVSNEKGYVKAAQDVELVEIVKIP